VLRGGEAYDARAGGRIGSSDCTPTGTLDLKDSLCNAQMDMPETNIDRLLKARAEIDEQLRQHKTNTAVLFTDVVASTKYFDRYGDTAGFAMVDRHAQLGASTVREFAGRVVKTIGDSVMAEFSDPVVCVRAAIELQRRLYNINEKLPERDRLQLRIGINYGSCFLQGGDLFGDAVNVAARITKHTGPGQILISSSVHRAIQKDPNFICHSLGQMDFKGKEDKEEIFEVVWTDPLTYTSLRRSNTVALARGELLSPGLKVEDLIQRPEDLTRTPESQSSLTAPAKTRVDSPATENNRAAKAAAPSHRIEAGSHRPPSHFEYEVRYVPGTTLGDRYRIVSPLGKGGMGEVYSAEDLKLGQTVALKFLPKSLAQNAEALTRFTREVRLARQVSHPNVCRVFDIGEADGQTFLTMELVDGEDLASLIRRIGRVPPDKALEIARHVCAGLAAAHEHGIIHRDLKPANIMLDGRGRARITDFGLAGFFTEVQGENARAGTPAYMSPEQLRGGEITPKSDLYSLGLVLYEIFTGKRPHEAVTIEEMARLREKSEPAAPSTHLKDIDPLVERVMLRCLERNPSKRPASALQVAAALPGGDPLAAALAAGETPSPEMVAAAGEKEGLRPGIAWGCLILIFLGLSATAVLSEKMQLPNLVPVPSPPEVLAARARDVARELGYTATPVDTAYSFALSPEYLHFIEKNDRSLTRWNKLSSGVPPIFTFWYRESPQFMSSGRFDHVPMVYPDAPPNAISGMCQMTLDAQGHLVEFETVPPQIDTSTEKASAPNWDGLFAAAGLDANQFKATAPQWTPLVTSDTRAAWEGTWPGRPELPLRVEAASYHGNPVYFKLVSSWTKPDRMQEEQRSTGESIGTAIISTIFLCIIVLGIVLARGNVRSGRGDRRGAARLALLAFLSIWVADLLFAHHVPTLSEFGIFWIATGWGLIYGALVWLLYVALEPHVRRRWPSSLISWSRLLTGQMRDPIVGRDLLVGILAGVFLAVARNTMIVAPGWMGKMPSVPDSHVAVLNFSGLHIMIGGILLNIVVAASLALACFFIFFLIRLVVRKEWLAVLVAAILPSLPQAFSDHPVLYTAFELLLCTVLLVVLIRFGLLALAVSLCVGYILPAFPLTTHLSAWYAEPTFFVFSLILATAIFGFYTSTRGKALFGRFSLDS
jgi:class 3 adenylate cyclase